jgi:sugar phosphate isomerase/epimerase
MRLGAPIPVPYSADPEAWANAQHAAGYSAVYVPFGPDADEATVIGFRDLCARHDLLIAEVGAWSNPISPDDATRKAAIEKCCRCLDLADRLGARCCVNIAGARGEQWDGPHPDNLSDATFDLIVQTVREIIDAVRPTRTYYTLETMPWIFPDSPESYANLITAIDREQFAVHLDPVNLINSPERFLRNADFLRHCFALLGPHIKACHAKDITLAPRLTVHLDEVRPGLGALDYGTLLREVDRLDPDIPFLLEHLPNPDEYTAAAEYVRSVAAREGITFR